MLLPKWISQQCDKLTGKQNELKKHAFMIKIKRKIEKALYQTKEIISSM